MHIKSKSQITTKSGRAVSKPAERRLPTHRPPTHPGEMLMEEFINPLNLSQTAFAARMGISYPRLNEIVQGKRGVSVDTALRLARVLGMPAEFWLGLQQDWDVWHAERSEKAADVARLVPIPFRSVAPHALTPNPVSK